AMFRTLLRWLPDRASPGAADAVRVPEPALALAAETPPAIAGVDTASGLARAGGNGELYRRLLRKYVDGQAGVADAIAAALASGGRTTAERLAHTTRGVSGSIGAARAQEAATTLERAIRDDCEHAGLIDALRAALDDTLDAIQADLGDAEAPPE